MAVTNVFITIDTELAAGLERRGYSLDYNYGISIDARCASGAYGAAYQARRLSEARLKAVFFVDPMPALLHGADFLRPLVEELLTFGHEVQLHLHPEWLALLDAPPVPFRGKGMADYSEDEQVALIACAAEQLVRTGAPDPIAFRAGNFLADARTLQALHRLGFTYDSSMNAAMGADLPMGLRGEIGPQSYSGVIEVPVTCITDWPHHLRPVQLCAMSAWEMRDGLGHAVRRGHTAYTIVSHSFELIDRKVQSPRAAMLARFEAMIDVLVAEQKEAPTVGFSDICPVALLATGNSAPLSFNPLRSAMRVCEQAAERERSRFNSLKLRLAQ